MPKKAAATEEDRPDTPEWSDEKVNDFIRDQENAWSERKKADQARIDQVRGVDGADTPTPEDRKDLLVDPKVIKGRRAMEIIDHFVGILAVHTQYQIDAYGVGGEPQLEGELFGDFLNAYTPATEYQSGEDTDLLTTRDALTIGYSAKKTLPYPPAYADWPMRARSEDKKRYTEDKKAYNGRVKQFEEEAPLVPIRTYHVPGIGWLPQLHGRKVIKSLEKKRVPVSWAKARYPHIGATWSTARESDEIDFYEIIDGTWCGYYVKGAPDGKAELGKFWRHGVELPDKVAPVSIFECNKTSDTDLLWRWLPLIESIRDPLEIEDMLLTQAATMFRAFWQPTIILELMEQWSPGLHAARARERKLKLGGTNIEFKGADGSSGERYKLFELPGKLPDATFLAEYSRERINAFLPAALTGNSPAGDSGYKANNDRNTAERKLGPIADNFARADADVGRHVAACMKSLAEMQGRPEARVTIRLPHGKGSKPVSRSYPEVAHLLTQIQTTREYILDTDWLQMADAATKFLSDPIRAPYRWVGNNILRWDNPNEMLNERRAEDIGNDPTFREKDIENTLIDMGVKAVEDYGVTTEELATLLANGGVLPPGIFMPRTLTQEQTAPAQADGGTTTAGAGVEGADAPVVESPAASTPIEPPQPAPDVRTAAPAPPVQSGRSGNSRRQPARPAPKRRKGTGK